MSKCGAYAAAVILGCSSDSTNCKMADSSSAKNATTDEVDETSNTGPIDSTNVTSVEALENCNTSSPLVITLKETVNTMKKHTKNLKETATGNKNEGNKNTCDTHHTA